MTRAAKSTHTGAGKAQAKASPRADQLRPLNLPQPVTVELDKTGLPSVVTSGVRPENEEERSEAIHSDLVGKAVESIIEIWHVDDEWWREPISRRCLEVILEGGKHVVLYEDLTTNAWFMQRP